MKITVINGPNLNLLGERDKNVYGVDTLKTVEMVLSQIAEKENVEIDFFQSNVEGEIIDKIQEVRNSDGLIINAGGYTHTSVAIRDALDICTCIKVEVHISNIHKREEFRRESLLSNVCDGSIIGLGTRGYNFALLYIISELKKKEIEKENNE